MKKGFTKKAANLNYKWHVATCVSLAEAYKTGGSQEKRAAEKRIYQEMQALGGHSFRIVSANTFNFSCAYVYYNEEGEARLRFYTAANFWDVPYMTMAQIYEIIK